MPAPTTALKRFQFRAFSAVFISSLLGLLSLLAGPVSGQTPTEPKADAPRTITIQIKGGIRPDLIPKVKESIAKATGDPLPAGLIVLLDSPGGDGLAAIEIGRLLREAHAHVFVSGRCSSACVFIFMGGVVRQAADGALGIHSARITRLDKETNKRIDVDLDKSPRAKQKLEEGNQQIRAFVQEMGILSQFSDAMNAVPHEQMRWLSRKEAKDLGIVGFEPSYLKLREDYLISRLRARPGDLERNTDQVLDRCFHEIAKGSFVRCYRLSLDRPTVGLD